MHLDKSPDISEKNVFQMNVNMFRFGKRSLRIENIFLKNNE